MTYRAAPRRSGQAPGRLRQERKIQKKAATWRVERYKIYSAKCAALSQPTSQETPCGIARVVAGNCRARGQPGLLTHAGRSMQPNKHRHPARAVYSRRAIGRCLTNTRSGGLSEETGLLGIACACWQIAGLPRAGACRNVSWWCRTSEHIRTPGRSAAAQKITVFLRLLLARFTSLTPESWGLAFVLKGIRTALLRLCSAC